MNAIDLINNIRLALDHLKKSGQTVVPIDRLEDYLTEMEKAAADGVPAAAAAERKFERDMEVWKVQTTQGVEMFKAVLDAGLNALKSAIIINGGAAIALLAFLGNLLEKTPPVGKTFPISDLAHSLLVFLVGAGCAGTASGIRYLGQASYAAAQNDQFLNKPQSCWQCVGNFFNGITIFLGTLSFIAFFYGGWSAYMAFTTP